MKNHAYLLLIFMGFLLGNCQNEPKKLEQSVSESKPQVLDGTAKMVQRLQQLSANINPMTIRYFENSHRNDQLQNQINNAPNLGEKLKARAIAANEEINVGNSEAAIRQLSALTMELKKMNIVPKSMNQINRILALAYLRLGEEQNCLGQMNNESCLLPIAGKGVYALQEAAKSAIQLYEGILSVEPNDLESVWLMNFAYMTMGKYPEGVPNQYLVPPTEFKSDIEIPKFKNIAQKRGIKTVALSGGVAFDDFNNDGLIDVVASSWGLNDQIRFFYNNGDGFTDVTEKTGLMGITGGLNITHLDYNNDGFLDIFVLRGAWFGQDGKFPNSLLKNNGNGTFSDVTEAAGLLSFAPTQTATWADFNLDGHLDVFIGNESMPNQTPFACEFYLNNGDGTFSNKTQGSGLHQLFGFIKGVTAGDVNNDGLPDLYLSLLGQYNFLLMNRGVNGVGVTFENVTDKAKVGKPLMSFPTWMWDFDNDGWLDIMAATFGTGNANLESPAEMLVTNAQGKYTGETPKFYKNNHDGAFIDESAKLGMKNSLFVMGSNFGDIDNDGYLDTYLGTGNPKFSAIVPNKMYRNNKGKQLQDVTTAGGFGHSQKGHAVGFADVDNDGDQDIFCVLGGAYENDVFSDALFLNPYGNQLNWVTLKLEGTTANRAAIGAKVQLSITTKNGQKREIYRWVNQGGSFGGNSLQLEIGLEDAQNINEIEVTWPNVTQSKVTFENVEMKQFYLIKEGAENLEMLKKTTLAFD
jgi:hypothetical protein